VSGQSIRDFRWSRRDLCVMADPPGNSGFYAKRQAFLANVASGME
jgi:hypothetical protein